MSKLRIVSGAVGAIAMAIATVTHFEGKSNKAYPDPVEIPTICYGHTAGVKYGDYRTDAECIAFLKEDTAKAQAAVRRYVKVPLTESQEAAFISFVYNAGEGNFARSSMLRKLNAGDYIGACNQFPRWVYSQGQKLPGLVRRRDFERQLCLNKY